MTDPATGSRSGSAMGPVERRALLVTAAALVGSAVMGGAVVARAAGQSAPEVGFASIDGGTLSLGAWRGRPVLVVNTASQCAFTPQYAGLQALSDRYAARGLVVLAVPSDDFNQELGSEAAVKEFCELTYNLTLPMTEITHVRGPKAHPFYRWLAQTHGFTPGWNFNKVLIGPDGALVQTWGSATRPEARALTGAIEALLGS